MLIIDKHGKFLPKSDCQTSKDCHTNNHTSL
jgi:hypothetical protein